MQDLYTDLDDEFNHRLGIDMGFTALIRSAPCMMDREAVQNYLARHALLQEFQETTLALFKASLCGDCDPKIAAMALGDLPSHLGIAYHRKLTERQHRTPVFFRTDEPACGKISEIQCPGSGWDLVQQLQKLYRRHPAVFGPPRWFAEPLALSFSNALRSRLGKPPVVHHLTDNASRPHGMRYFIQETRAQGLRYFGYDRDIAPGDCNFVRSHDFITLPHHNFFAERMERCNDGDLEFDLPPTALFDGKLILAWPFWHRTRDLYPSRLRTLFPFTNIIIPDGFELMDGSRVSLTGFFRMPRRQRKYYVKYAGTDIALNWGSKGVYLASSLSQKQAAALLETVAADYQRGRHWIIQEALQHQETVEGLTREGERMTIRANAKFSGFYGPAGLMAVLVMHQAARKVHGSAATIMSVVP